VTEKTSEIGIVRAVFELFGIVLVRFRPVQRLWGTWLVAVNVAALLFVGHVEAWVALGAVGVAVVAQALIYRRRRFVRILGATHFFVWIPMFAWMATRMHAIPAGETAFRAWLFLLIATNSICLAIDACDSTRFVLGDRHPYYVW
jgi:hypothetical protein